MRAATWIAIGGAFAIGLAPASARVRPTPAAASPTSPATSFSLDGTWQFALAPTPADAAKLDHFYEPGADTTSFTATPVPSNWALQGFEPPHYKPFHGEASEGFYLRHFTPPPGWKGKRILLDFGGVWSSAEIWLNGTPLGRVDSGYTKIAVDVSHALKPGEDNLLAVRVRQIQPSYLFDTNDDWTLGGIYRSVSLEAMPADRWLDRVEVQTLFDDQYRDADLKIRVMVGDKQKKIPPGNFMFEGGHPYALRFVLTDASGKTVSSEDVDVPAHPGTGRETIETLHIAAPSHWTAETPNLYHLRVDLLEDGKPSQSRDVEVGFRQISTKGGVLRLNGQAIKLRGVDRHDEYPDVGRATTPAQWLRDLTLMKAANINYIRLAHYPPAQGFLDLCDKLGMYVSDEVPMGSGGDNMDDPILAGAAMLRSYETVARDINHPSIIIWSIGNEDPLTSLHLAAIRTVKGLDPTRPVLMPWRAETWLPPEIDILAPHYFTAEKYDQLAARSDRPIVSTEYSHAYGNDGFGGLEDRWRALTRHPSGAGGAIWMWADQGIEVATRHADGSITHSLKVIPDGFDGITDSYRNPTRDYWEAKAVYAQAYPAISQIQAVDGQQSVHIPIQNDFDFSDLSTIGLRWSLQEDGHELASGSAKLAGPAHAQSTIELPLAGIGSFKPGSTYFYQLTFLRSDGSEITRRSVELINRTAELLPPPAPSPVALSVQESGTDTVVTAGQRSYGFSKTTGFLTRISGPGTLPVTGLRPTLWRPLNETERGIVKGEKGVQDLPDLNAFTPTVKHWTMTRTAGSVTLHADGVYRVDTNDSFAGSFDYTIDSSGRLIVRYAIEPTVQAKWLPFVGMMLESGTSLAHLHWLGLGPLDAYPNEHSATPLGVWDATLGTGGGFAMKATRWADLTDDSSRHLLVRNSAFVSYDPKAPTHLLLLSSVLGRPTKGWRPESPDDRLDVVPGKRFAGEFVIDPSPAP